MLAAIVMLVLVAPPKESPFVARVDALRELRIAGRVDEVKTTGSALLDELTEAARTKPRDATILLQLGRTQLYLDDVEAAVKTLDETIALAPRDGLARMYRGSAALQLGEYVEAREFFRKATELAPNEARGWSGLGMALVEGNPSEGLAALKKAVALNPKDSASLALIGDTLCQARRFTECLGFLEKALAVRPNDPRLAELTGDAAQAAGKYPVALAQFESLAKADPSSWMVRTKLVQVSQAMGDFAARDRWRAEVIKLNPKKEFCRDLFMFGTQQVAAFEEPDSGAFNFRVFTPRIFEPERGFLLTAPGSERDGGPKEWTLDDALPGRVTTLRTFATQPTYDEVRKLVIDALHRK
ncbi:MAG: tetratricopeptide repeat protein [Myxococcaceae bacterium]